jgi:hypothetical protein
MTARRRGRLRAPGRDDDDLVDLVDPVDYLAGSREPAITAKAIDDV